MREQLIKAGVNVGKMKLISAWQKAALVGDERKRRMMFWGVVRKDLELQDAACVMLDELLLRGYGQKQHESQGMPADTLQQANSAMPIGSGADSKMNPIVSVRPSAPSLEARRSALKVAVTIFDSYKLEDGTPIGDVKMAHIPAIKARYTRHAALLDMIYGHATPDDPQATVRESIKHETIVRMIQRAAQVQDVAA